jgi:hypothetical protein
LLHVAVTVRDCRCGIYRKPCRVQHLVPRFWLSARTTGQICVRLERTGRATDTQLIGGSPETARGWIALKGHSIYGVDSLTSRQTRCESGKRLNDDTTLASGTRSSVDNEPPANFVMFTNKMAGSNNHFTRFLTTTSSGRYGT